VCVCALLMQLSSTQSTRTIFYCDLRPVWLYHIAPHYLITGMILRGEGGGGH
jgi:hypothetical protein